MIGLDEGAIVEVLNLSIVYSQILSLQSESCRLVVVVVVESYSPHFLSGSEFWPLGHVGLSVLYI